MNRDLFLTRYWRRFPIQSETAVGVSSWLAGEAKKHELIGGRLRDGAGGLELESDGARISLEFEPDARWSEWSLLDVGGAPTFDPSLLRPGDLVCVRQRDRNVRGAFRVSEIALLFAASDPQWRDARAGRISVSIDSERARKWHTFTDSIRSFFTRNAFIEAQTPTLVPSPGTEPFLEPFVTEARFGTTARRLFLPTSPEFHLKKLLVAGWTRVFELKTCFRNDEGGRHHQAEFTMLEWYRAFSNLDAIAADVEALIVEAASALKVEVPKRVERISVADLFLEEFLFKLEPQTSFESLVELARKEGIATASDDTWDEVYFRIFISRLEPRLSQGGPWLLCDYPPSQAALARINSKGWADRFEIYWKGLEIANAFHELNDPELNLERFRDDLAARTRLGRTSVPVDEQLVDALFAGMPPSGGIALGVDRLFMALLGIDDIGETRPFPWRQS